MSSLVKYPFKSFGFVCLFVVFLVVGFLSVELYEFFIYFASVSRWI